MIKKAKILVSLGIIGIFCLGAVPVIYAQDGADKLYFPASSEAEELDPQDFYVNPVTGDVFTPWAEGTTVSISMLPIEGGIVDIAGAIIDIGTVGPGGILYLPFFTANKKYSTCLAVIPPDYPKSPMGGEWVELSVEKTSTPKIKRHDEEPSGGSSSSIFLH